MNNDGEITALMALWLNYKRLFAYFLPLSLLVFIGSIMLSVAFEPWIHREMDLFTTKKTEQKISKMLNTDIQPNVFTENFFGHVFYATDIVKSAKDQWDYKNIILSPNYKTADAAPFIVSAQQGSLLGDVKNRNLQLTLFNGDFITMNKKTRDLIKFKKANINIMTLINDKLYPPRSKDENLHTLSLPALSAAVTEHIDNYGLLDKRTIKAEYLFYFKIFNHFGTFSFTLLAVAFLTLGNRRKSNQGYLAAAATTVAYWILIMIHHSLQTNGLARGLTLSLLPQVLFLIVALLLFRMRLKIEASVSLRDALLLKIKRISLFR